jgi:hypothetical protein
MRSSLNGLKIPEDETQPAVGCMPDYARKDPALINVPYRKGFATYPRIGFEVDLSQGRFEKHTPWRLIPNFIRNLSSDRGQHAFWTIHFARKS